jgi:hypothetical protein
MRLCRNRKVRIIEKRIKGEIIMENFSHHSGLSEERDSEEGPRKNKTQKQNTITPNVESGQSYLVKEGKPKISFDMFFKEAEGGAHGLLVSHTYPDIIADRFKAKREEIIKNTMMVWLTYQMGYRYINPSDTGMLVDLIERFTKDQEKSVVMLDGIEYLIVNNGFEKVMNSMRSISEVVKQNRSILIIPIETKAVEKEELAILERELEVIKG